MSLQALIWDVDGTLAETEDRGHRIAFNRAFEEAGFDWHWDSNLYADLLKVTGGKERLLAWWRRVDPAGAAAEGAMAKIRQLHERKTAHYLALLGGGAILLRPGVERLLLEASDKGLKQAIATTTTFENVRRLLDVALGQGATTLFDVIGAGDVVAAKKPAPDIYHWVLERLGMQASECLAIEDSRAGESAAVAAGVPVLLVRSRFTPPLPARGSIDDLHSLYGVTLAELRRLFELSSNERVRAEASLKIH